MNNLTIKAILTTILMLAGILQGCGLTAQNERHLTFQPTALRCELLKGAVLDDIRDDQPEFSWEITHWAHNNQRTYVDQVAYQIQVFAQPTDSTPNLLWDSGKQLSAISTAHSYSGPLLQPATTYQWRVKTWLKINNTASLTESIWSEFQTFTTATGFDQTASRHRLTQTVVEAKSITQLPSGRYLIDFGKVAFGYLALELASSKAGQVKVNFAERGSEKGAMSALHKKSSVRYYEVDLQVNENFDVYRVHPPRDKRNTKPNIAIAIPAQFGRIAPFRYVEIDAGDLTISQLKAQQVTVHYPFSETASTFKSNDPVLNAIWDLSKYSMKATSFAGVYVDGDRERIPYEADAYINQLSHYLVDSEYALARYSHEYLMVNPTWPTEWKQHSVMMAWADWMYTGDLESMAHFYTQLQQQKVLTHLANQDGLLVSYPLKKRDKSRDLVDWPPGERDGFEFKKINAVVNAFHYLNLNQMADMAQALGKTADAASYKAKAKQLKTAFNAALFDSKTGLYVDGVGSTHSSAHANILPLAVGLVPNTRKPNVLQFLREKGMAVSVYFAQYLLEALYLNNDADYALELLTSKQKRSWFNMLRVGSTITLEAWDDEYKLNQDWNHAWGAVPGNIVGRFILGIKPLTAGFKVVEIAPQLSTLAYAKGKVPTILGPINIEAEQDYGQAITVKFTIPNNMQAQFVLPQVKGKQIETVRFNGRVIEQALIQHIEQDQHRVALKLNSSDTGHILPSGEHVVQISYK